MLRDRARLELASSPHKKPGQPKLLIKHLQIIKEHSLPLHLASNEMWRHHLNGRNALRFYHNARPSEFGGADKRPKARVANSQISNAIRHRRHAESQFKVAHEPASGRTFEPFPFAVTEENRLECLKRALTPLHDVPYQEQLSSKETYCRNALRLFAQELYKQGTPVRLDVRRLPCQVKSIVPSPVLTRYRNKDEFSIWRGLDGKTITCGHMIFPISKHGDTVCVEPNGLDVMREETIAVTELLQEFLRHQAKLGVCFSLGTDGGWRRFLVRCSLAGELMLIGQLSPRTLKVREVLEERDNFKEFMVRRSQEEGLKLASLYYQPCPSNHCLHKDVPYELLHGSETIIETLGPFRVNLSPESYVHNSTPGARTLFETVKQSIDECFGQEYDALGGAKPFFINMGCGAGALALYLAQMSDGLVGLDRNEQSIRDAEANAQLNQVENVEFIGADVEVVLGRVLEKHGAKRRQIIAVSDLTNSGLHRQVASTLAQCHDVNKILLIIPKLESTKIMMNLTELCSSRGARSLPPFAPIMAVPVDTCPHTQSFQTILVLERLPG